MKSYMGVYVCISRWHQNLESSSSRSLRFQTIISQTGIELGHLLLLITEVMDREPNSTVTVRSHCGGHWQVTDNVTLGYRPYLILYFVVKCTVLKFKILWACGYSGVSHKLLWVLTQVSIHTKKLHNLINIQYTLSSELFWDFKIFLTESYSLKELISNNIKFIEYLAHVMPALCSILYVCFLSIYLLHAIDSIYLW